MFFSNYRPTLTRNLLLIISLKILFLTAFWQLVLKHQAVHADTQSMSEQFLPPNH